MKTGSTATRTSKTRAASAWALVVLLIGLVGSACGRGSKPIVILISLDGWRHDYLERADAPALKSLAASGVRSEGLIPVFPSKTFPNHYTIVTGLYTEHHGIIANNMIDDAISDEPFTMAAKTSRDARWWGGEPLWVTAERQGQRAASMFWPGSEVDVGGIRPSYWTPYQDDLPHRDRVNRVLDWLRLPDGERPTFITLYFSEVDTIGHRFGPDSREVLEAAARLDTEVGALIRGVEALSLDAPVHYVVVSDHGMSQLSTDRVIVLDDYIDMETVETIDFSPVVGIMPRSSSIDEIVSAFRDKHPHLSVYRREEVPERLHYRDHPRIPPVIVLADDGWTLASRTQVLSWERQGRVLGGAHGYDPIHKSMQGLLIAAGPSFRRGILVPPLENIHLYEMMARVLRLTPAPNDGSRAETNALFR